MQILIRRYDNSDMIHNCVFDWYNSMRTTEEDQDIVDYTLLNEFCEKHKLKMVDRLTLDKKNILRTVNVGQDVDDKTAKKICKDFIKILSKYVDSIDGKLKKSKTKKESVNKIDMCVINDEFNHEYENSTLIKLKKIEKTKPDVHDILPDCLYFEYDEETVLFLAEYELKYSVEDHSILI